MRLDVLLREARWRAGKPGVDDRVPHCALRDLLESDEDGWITVEVRDREERFRIRREHGFLLPEFLDAGGNYWTVWRSDVAEAFRCRPC